MSDICFKIYKTLLKRNADRHAGQPSIIGETVFIRLKIDGVINQSEFAVVTTLRNPLAQLVELFHTILPAKGFNGLAGIEKVFRENDWNGLHTDLISISSNYFELNDERIAEYTQLIAAINQLKRKELLMEEIAVMALVKLKREARNS